MTRLPHRKLKQVLADAADCGMSEVAEARLLMSNAYGPRVRVRYFGQAASTFKRAELRLRVAAQLAEAMILVVRSQREHCVGERNFFRRRYRDAQRQFRTAERSLRDAIALLRYVERVTGGGVVAHLREYRRYYEIEAVEAAAFLLSSKKQWTQAILTHEREIRLCEVARAAHAGSDVFLDRFFTGHVWFARSSRLRCLASLAKLSGDSKSARKRLEEAKRAEALSVKLNPQWQ